jgi:hypothetical protein
MANSRPSDDPAAEPAAIEPAAQPRKTYESTLLPERHRRRVPPWIAGPAILVVIVLALLTLYRISHARRSVPTAGEVVYSAAPSGLFVVKTDGIPAKPLHAPGTGPMTPVFSPDGNQIAYLASQTGAQREIFVMDGDGKNGQEATHSGLSKVLPSFAPSDRTLVGPNLPVLGKALQHAGTLLAYLCGGALYTTDLRGSTARILPGTPQQAKPDADADSGPIDSNTSVVSYAWMPVADPNRQGLAAILDEGGLETVAILPNLSSDPILTVNGDPKGPPMLVGSDLTCAWSPDGSELAVAGIGVTEFPGMPIPHGKSITGLFFFNANGGLARHPLLFSRTAPVGPENPVYTPDGTRIAFGVFSEPDLAHRRQFGLFVAAADGSGQPQRIVPAAADDVTFDPTGTMLYFLAPRRDGGHDLIAIGPNGGVRLSDGVQDVTAYMVSPQPVAVKTGP